MKKRDFTGNVAGKQLLDFYGVMVFRLIGPNFSAVVKVSFFAHLYNVAELKSFSMTCASESHFIG